MVHVQGHLEDTGDVLNVEKRRRFRAAARQEAHVLALRHRLFDDALGVDRCVAVRLDQALELDLLALFRRGLLEQLGCESRLCLLAATFDGFLYLRFHVLVSLTTRPCALCLDL